MNMTVNKHLAQAVELATQMAGYGKYDDDTKTPDTNNQAPATKEMSEEELYAIYDKLRRGLAELLNGQSPYDPQKLQDMVRACALMLEKGINSIANEEVKAIMYEFIKMAREIVDEAIIKTKQDISQMSQITEDAIISLNKLLEETMAKIEAATAENESDDNNTDSSSRAPSDKYAKRDFSNIPYVVLTLMVLNQSIDIMADQSQIALQKVKNMQKLIELIQALNRMYVAQQAKLNEAFSEKTEADSKKKGGNDVGQNNNMNWEDTTKNYGEGVRHEEYDFSKYNGSYDDKDLEKLYENPIIRFLKSIGALTVGDKKGAYRKVTIRIVDIASLTTEQKNAFKVALDKYNADKDEKKYKDYKVKTYVTDPVFYDKDGNQVIGQHKFSDSKNFMDNIDDYLNWMQGKVKGEPDNNPKYDGTVIYDKADIPAFMLPYLEEYGLSTTKGGPIEYYALKDEDLKKICAKIVSDFNNTTDSAEDFTVETVYGSMKGTIPETEQGIQVINSKLEMLMRLISAESEKPGQAKNNADYLLRQFINILNGLTYRVGG